MDMLVKLYDLPTLDREYQAQGQSLCVRPALVCERHQVQAFVREHFDAVGTGWANESDIAFCRLPVSCFIAVERDEVLGFACYDVIAKGAFGPTGVLERVRGRGVGRALLLNVLRAMRAAGYAYAVIAGVGPAGFYERVAGACAIRDSEPGLYSGMLSQRARLK